MATSTNCNKCGRPMVYAKENKCNYCDSCMSEYCGCKLGRIKEIEPTCDSTAVIPSITVESVEGITNLANCLVHVEDINTTFYIDDKHRVMITWAGPVDIPGYDMENNPNGYRDQIVTDIEKGLAVIYDKHGKGYTFGIYDSLDSDGAVTQAINDKLDEMATDGTLEDIIATYIADVAHVFDTVADMKAATNLTAGGYARTLGYHAKNDMGGSTYKIRAKASGETANEIDKIGLSDAAIIAEIVPEYEMNVKQFGAKGDGITDETSLVKSIFTYGSGIGLKNIAFPAGTYNINDTVNLYSNLNISGAGIGATILKFTPDTVQTSNKYLLYFNNRQNLTVTGITFEGAKSPDDNTIVEDKLWHSLTLGYSSDIVIDKCEFRYFITSGISIRNSSNITISRCVFTSNGWNDIAITRLTDNIKVVNNYFTNVCHRGVNAEDGAVDQPCTNILVDGNTFKTSFTGTNTRAVSFSNGSLSGDIHRYFNLIVTNNSFKGFWEGILYHFVKDVVISDNIFEGARFINSIIGNQTSYDENIIISGNRITMSHPYTGDTYAVDLQGNNDVQVVNNYMEGASTRFVTSYHSNNIIIDGNIIRNGSEIGILAEGNNVSISNNEIDNVASYGLHLRVNNLEVTNNKITNTGDHGIYLADAVSNQRLEGNYVFNATGYGVYYYNGVNNKFAVFRNNYFGEDRVTKVMTHCFAARVNVDYVVVENTYILTSGLALSLSGHWGTNCYFRNNDGFGTLPA